MSTSALVLFIATILSALVTVVSFLAPKYKGWAAQKRLKAQKKDRARRQKILDRKNAALK